MQKYYSDVNRSKVKEETAASHIENIIRGEFIASGKAGELRKVYSNIIQYNYSYTHPGRPNISQLDPINVLKIGYDYSRNDYQQKYKELKNEE